MHNVNTVNPYFMHFCQYTQKLRHTWLQLTCLSYEHAASMNEVSSVQIISSDNLDCRPRCFIPAGVIYGTTYICIKQAFFYVESVISVLNKGPYRIFS